MANYYKENGDGGGCHFTSKKLVKKSSFTTPKVTENFHAKGRDPCVATDPKETKLKRGQRKVLDIFFNIT